MLKKIPNVVFFPVLLVIQVLFLLENGKLILASIDQSLYVSAFSLPFLIGLFNFVIISILFVCTIVAYKNEEDSCLL